jgi:polysaccharide export outer membrane protein
MQSLTARKGERLQPRWRSCFVFAALVCPCSCADLGKYVWVKDYAQPSVPVPGNSEDVISPGDLLAVRVYNQEAMSTPRVRVRPDGKITLPFLNDVQAAGLKPAELGRQLEVEFKEFLKQPVVTVSWEEHTLPISVVGEVARQGIYQVEPGVGLLHVLALAGGLTEVAHRDRIFVRREKPAPVRIRFTYDALAHEDGPAAQFRLQRGDMVVVE